MEYTYYCVRSRLLALHKKKEKKKKKKSGPYMTHMV